MGIFRTDEVGAVMNFRKRAEMLVLFPKVQLATFTDNTMPRRNWSVFDAPPDEVRKANVAKLRIDRARRKA